VASNGGDRPRLLVLTPDFPPAQGGVQVIAHRLATGMQGLHARVVTLDQRDAAGFDARSGVETRRVRNRASRRAANALLNAAALREAVRFRPHATLSAHIVASPAAAVVRAALGAPAVQYFHANEITDKPRLAAFAASRADAVVAVSSYCSGLIAATGASPRCLRLIPPGVELPEHRPSPPPMRPIVLTIARLRDRYKGHDVLIGAVARVRARVPDVQWVVIGEGPLRAELEALARSAGVADATRFLEAAAHEKPVVAGNVAGALDAVADGESGLLVDPTDEGAVAGAITTLLQDRELARRLGAAGAARARSYAWPLIAARVQALLLELLARTPPRAGRGAREAAGRGAA